MNYKSLKNSRSNSVSQTDKFKSLKINARSTVRRSPSSNSIHSLKIQPFRSKTNLNNSSTKSGLLDKNSKNNIKPFEVSKKRKFNAFNNASKGSLVEKSKINTIKSKIEEMFRKMNLDNNWKNTFKELFEKEKVIDFSSRDFFPKSLNQIGSFIMKSEKFWVMWIEIIKKELKLETLIKLTNNAISYVSDSKLITITFNRTINFLKISKKTINEYSKIEGINTDTSNSIGEYDYLLDKKSMNKFNLRNNSQIQKQSICSSKSKNISFIERNYNQKQISTVNYNSSSQPSYVTSENYSSNVSKVEFINFKENIISSINKLKPESTQSFQTFSIYDLITNSNESETREIDLQNSLFNLYPTNLTINETQNEETLNDKKLLISLDQISNSNLTIRSEKNEIFCDYNMSTPAKQDKLDYSRYEEKLNKNCEDIIDTKSIVDEIEKITTTLKKEIEQLKSPEFLQNAPSFEYSMKKCCFLHNEYNHLCFISHNCEDAIEEIANSYLNSIREDVVQGREDSYEKHLKELAEKRGEDVSEYIAFSDFKPEVNDLSRISVIDSRYEEKHQEDSARVEDESADRSGKKEVRRKSKRTPRKNKSKSKSRSKSKSKSKNTKSKSKSKNKNKNKEEM